MNWKELDRESGENIFNDYCDKGIITCPQEYMPLRNDICSLFYEALSEIGISAAEISRKNYSYQVDYIFGLKLYSLLNDKYGMSVRDASNASVWRYLCVCVVPDIVDARYGKQHPDRFWKKPKRLWFRVLWWYIYLSWQGDEEKTKEVLKDNSTDEILQLVDRCGRGGYRVDLYRELMLQRSCMDPDEKNKNKKFRKVMVLNTARVQTIEPGLVSGGEKEYVSGLYNYFKES